MKSICKTTLLAATLITLVSSLSFAKKAKNNEKKEAAPTAEVIINTLEGQVKWTGYGVGKSHGGTLQIKSGEIKLVDDVATQLSFVVDMKSLTSPDSEKLVGHLKNSDFFDVEKFSEGIFKSTEIKLIKQAKANGSNYSIKGDLTIKGKTNPIEFTASISHEGKKYMGLAEFEIADRTKYDIVYNSDKFLTVSKLGDKLIKNNIALQVSITTK